MWLYFLSQKVLETSEQEAQELKKKLYQDRLKLERKLDMLKKLGSDTKRPRNSEGDSTTSEEIDIENDQDEGGWASSESDDAGSSGGSDAGLTANTRKDL